MDSTTLAPLKSLLAIAKDAEACRDIPRWRDTFYPLWPDLEADPDFSKLPLQADLLRSAGRFLSEYGRMHGLEDYQLRAKNILTQAIGLYEYQLDSEGSANAQVDLANCYLYQGEIAEFTDILKSIDAAFPLPHSAAIKTRLNVIIRHNLHGDGSLAYRALQEVAEAMRECTDDTLLAQFYNVSGMTYLYLGEYRQSLAEFENAADICRAQGSESILSLNLNAIAIAHLQLGETRTAHEYIVTALDKVPYGLRPHFLDTLAAIQLAQDDVKAISTVNEAINGFRKTEDYGGLVNSLFTKCRCELRTDPEQAALTFAELEASALMYAGRKVLEAYQALLDKERILIFEEQQEKKSRILLLSEGFYFPPSVMRNFGIETGSVVQVVPLGEYDVGDWMLVEHQGALKLGRLFHQFGLYMIGDGPASVLLEDSSLIGSPIAYCPIEKAQNGVVEFTRL